MSGAVAAMMLGASGGSPGVINQSAGWPTAISPTGASLNLYNDGSFDGDGTTPGDWVDPSTTTVAAYYQVRVDALSGSFTTGTTGTWLDLSSTRSWSVNSGAAVIFDISIREKATGIVRMTLTAEELNAV